MRVLLDPNVYVSHLLGSRRSDSPIRRIIDAATEGRFTLVVPMDVIGEVERVVRTRPHLASRIAPEAVGRFFDDLERIAEIVPDYEDDIPSVVRDRSDDYLVAQAIQARVDVVVSGDKDLLALRAHHSVRFVNPASFAVELAL